MSTVRTDHWLVRRLPTEKDWVDDIVVELRPLEADLERMLAKAVISPVWGTYTIYLDRSPCCASIMTQPYKTPGCMGCGGLYPDLVLSIPSWNSTKRPARMATLESWFYTLNPLQASFYAHDLYEVVEAQWTQIVSEGKVLNLHG